VEWTGGLGESRVVKAGQGGSKLVRGVREGGSCLRLRPPSESAAATARSKDESAWRRDARNSSDVASSATEEIQPNPSKSNQELMGALLGREVDQGTRRSASLRWVGFASRDSLADGGANSVSA